MLAGLEEVDEGRLLIGDQDVTDLPPKARDIAMVFQNYALYPHMTVAENMGFALKIAGANKSDINKRVAEAAAMLDITEYLDRKPKALSGGQRQRVAMGRAIVRSPRVFLMDEPLSNLDAKLRVQTRTQIAQLQRRLGTTTVYVTHDQVEAMTMGDRVAVLKDGVLQQCAAPREMYDRPANLFVAGFMGSPSMNLMELPVVDGGVRFGDLVVPVARDTLADRRRGDRDAGHPAGEPRRQRQRPQARGRRRRGARRRRIRLWPRGRRRLRAHHRGPRRLAQAAGQGRDDLPRAGRPRQRVHVFATDSGRRLS